MTNDAISWLAEDENLSVKFRTLTDICGITDETTLDTTYRYIWEQKEIVKLFNKQDSQGLWSDKDYGVHTSLRYLSTCAEYGLKKDIRLDSFVGYAIEFLVKKADAPANADYSGCANALVLRSLIMLGYGDRADVSELIAKYADSQLSDGGFICKRLLDKKPERKSCYRASLAGLLLYAECKLKNILPDNSNKLVNYFLKRDVFYSSDKTKNLADGKPGWRFIDNFFPAEPMRFGLVQIAAALSVLGAGSSPAMHETWQLLKEKETGGRYMLEGTLTKQPCSFGKIGQPNKWVTFYAVMAEKYRNL